MRRLLLPLALVAPFAPPSVAAAREGVDEAQLLAARAAEAVAVMQGAQRVEEVFSPGYIAVVPPARLAQISADLVRAHGRIVGADEVRRNGRLAARFRLVLENAQADAAIRLAPAPPYRIDSFIIAAPTPRDASPERLLADFAALPGRAGFAVSRLPDDLAAPPVPILSQHGAESFATGSTFKLWVLDALAEEVAAGRLAWDQVVRLDGHSLPSGIAQDWPLGTPVTLDTLATLMISISDNTATDQLIRVIGRERVEARVRASGHAHPERMEPFLTTAEAFAIKSAAPELAARYDRGDTATRRAIVASLAGRLTPADMNPGKLDSGQPVAIDTVEWFASPQDVIGVLAALHRRSDPRVGAILAVEPHLPANERGDYRYAGYKGGSESGVIAMNWLVRGKSGDWFTVAASWNDASAPVDLFRFEQLALRLVRLVNQAP